MFFLFNLAANELQAGKRPILLKAATKTNQPLHWIRVAGTLLVLKVKEAFKYRLCIVLKLALTSKDDDNYRGDKLNLF